MPLDTTQSGIAALIALIPQTGSATGNVPTVPLPLAVMDLTISAPLAFDAGTKTMTVDTSGLATSAQGALAASALQTISIGTVSTGTAHVTASTIGAATTLSFVVPQGIQGTTGTAATISAGTVTLLAAGSSPTVTNSGSSSAATFNFGLPYSPARTFNNAASHALITTAAAANGYQVSATQDAHISYEVSITTTATIGGSGDGSVVLEICSTNSATAGNWVEVGRVRNAQTITLAIALNSVQVVVGFLACILPAGYYVRQRQITTSGTVSFGANATGQEVLL